MQSPHVPPGDLVPAPEAARLLGVNRYTFYRWLKRGYVPHHRFGRIIRVSLRDLAGFVERMRADPVGLGRPPIEPTSPQEIPAASAAP